MLQIHGETRKNAPTTVIVQLLYVFRKLTKYTHKHKYIRHPFIAVIENTPPEFNIFPKDLCLASQRSSREAQLDCPNFYGRSHTWESQTIARAGNDMPLSKTKTKNQSKQLRDKKVRRWGLRIDDPELQKLIVLIPNHAMYGDGTCYCNK